MFSLIPIPSEPIRQNWLRHYRMLERKLNKLKSDWRLFELESQPLYQKWYYSTFQNELARVRDWTEKAQEQDRILSAIVAHQRIYGLDELEAYVRVRMKLRQKRDPFPDVEDIEKFQREQRERAERSRARRHKEQERRERERERRRREAGPQTDEENQFWEFVQRQIREQEEAARQAGTGRSGGDGREPGPERVVRAAETVSAEERRADDLKTLYRKIVRALHPDSGREMSVVEKEWWNQAQDAYKRHDLETLKLIALKVQSEGDVKIEEIDQISTLVDLCAALIDERDELESQRKRLKRDPVFRFWSSRARPRNREKLRHDLKQTLEQQARELRDFVRQTEATLEELDRMLQYRFSR